MSDYSKKNYMSIINDEAHSSMIQLITVSLLLGSVVFFIAHYIFSGEDFLHVLGQSMLFVLIALATQFIRLFHIKSRTKTVFISGILSTTYIFLYILRNSNGFATFWGVTFLFMAIALIYTSRTILITQASTSIAVELYHTLLVGDNEITVDSADHFGRIGIILLVLLMSVAANRLLRMRLLENQQKHVEISRQKEELTVLYKKLQSKEEHLRNQHEKLGNSFKEIDRLAHYDNLTGLPKRQRLFEDIEAYIEQIKNERSKEHFTMILIDLDNFKVINDLHGHEVGDHYLIHTADILSSLVKPYKSRVYRIGSDDFVILTEKTTASEPILPILNSLIRNFATPMEYELYSIRTTVSIGVCDFPHGGNHAKVLLRNADIALHQAKAIGKSNYVFFDDAIEEKLLRKLNLQEELKMAIENNGLSIHYQPIINLKTKAIDSFEALLRWTSPTFGRISPMEFIPYAEENMTIIPIGLWVIKKSMHFIQEINNTFDKDYKVSVNVSTIQLNNRQFLNDLDILFKESECNPTLLDFEVTESIFIESFEETIILLSTLRDLGITISLDDFGTGYSSLTYLKQLPIDHIKIDKSFIKEMSDTDNPLVESIISLAHRLHVSVIAEGVETSSQLSTLTDHGSDYAQGYHFTRPLPPEELIGYISKHNDIIKKDLS